MRRERKMLVDEEKEGVFATKACVLQDLYENTHHHTTSCVSHVQKCKSLLFLQIATRKNVQRHKRHHHFHHSANPT